MWYTIYIHLVNFTTLREKKSEVSRDAISCARGSHQNRRELRTEQWGEGHSVNI